ncbi:MAG: sulfatase-like hydrolase/transferase [Candidatus Aminicenantes bacterium]|nr:sulfatase-like hydrolase/transferase [Candidatus Aminicenantes bacterium]
MGKDRSPKKHAETRRPAPGAMANRRSRSALVVGAGIIALGLLAYFLLVRPGRVRIGPPGGTVDNVLLITLDTTRADHLGCYGYPRAKTPNLDDLARGGIRFARVYCPAPLTLPSHCSIMSGLYPIAHGVRNNGHELPQGIRTLAEIMKGQGYSTSAFVSSFSVDSRFGLGRGFDVYDDNFQPQAPMKGANAERRAEETFARFSRWLDNNGQGKFFAWVHYYDPHLPYDPPSPYKEDSAGRPYDGEIAYMDHYIGAVLERLKAKGLLDKTLIVVAGDHGEGLGDKVETGHGIFLYEETLRVPLIFHHLKAFPRPRVVESAVRLVDVAPTILEMIGLKSEAAGMQGQTLTPWIRKKTGADLDSLVETFYPRENFGWSELVGIVSGPWKYIQAPRPELYDLKSDLREKIDLTVSAPAKAGELRTKLEQELLRLSAPVGATDGQAAVRTDDRERLRSLGYVNFAPAKPGSFLPDPKDKISSLRLIQQAQAYEFEEKYPEAERVYRQLMEDMPDSPASYVNLAIAQARQNRFDQAIATLDLGIARIPDSEILLVRLGHTYLVTGRVQEALATMEKVLVLNSQNVEALTVCAGALEATGRKDDARAYYERALAIEPESRHLRMSYAGNLASGGKLKEAIKVYESLIGDFPEEQAFYQFAGIAYSYLGEFEHAISLLEQAVAIRPTAVGYFNLALAHEKSGDLRQAIEYFRLYLENSRGESEVNIRKAKAELERLEKKVGSISAPSP